MSRSESSLRGLALGDAFGQTWFTQEGDLRRRRVAPGPWTWTDDTAMALALFRVLRECGRVDQDALAAEFATTYVAEPRRGYGATMHDVLTAIHSGQPWRDVARRQFDGQGSWGNGAAMRVAPLGAWFADDLDELVVQAGKSAGVTHAHPEAIAGAVAVALATALGVRGAAGADLLGEVVERLPETEVRAGLIRARRISFTTDSRNAGGTLGTGLRISAVDTVPFALWCAARHLDDLVEALWVTAAAGGDVDTTCAIVGGVVAARTGLDGVPQDWLDSSEPLPPFA
ncbi:ADP-ribosylglycohydrolase family protein [Allokutzneria albata]|uniref:ADP-ribosylglycohydrolase n=1 Tax=Allokutzneria albata TaxID=211114 RepID=A0A1G9UX90_ALLAB|nr:ADP-ribosylglycohydrolase family protein [Allokutzneria albata]SDM64427.1 ADP-ribosylglycohydrolase [Allokutzneria albata]